VRRTRGEEGSSQPVRRPGPSPPRRRVRSAPGQEAGAALPVPAPRVRPQRRHSRRPGCPGLAGRRTPSLLPATCRPWGPGRRPGQRRPRRRPWSPGLPSAPRGPWRSRRCRARSPRPPHRLRPRAPHPWPRAPRRSRSRAPFRPRRPSPSPRPLGRPSAPLLRSRHRPEAPCRSRHGPAPRPLPGRIGIRPVRSAAPGPPESGRCRVGSRPPPRRPWAVVSWCPPSRTDVTAVVEPGRPAGRPGLACLLSVAEEHSGADAARVTCRREPVGAPGRSDDTTGGPAGRPTSTRRPSP